MRARSLIILLLSLGVVAGAAALVIHWKKPKRADVVLGTRLLSDLAVNQVASVTIKSVEDGVSLVREQDGWVVANRFNYPANFNTVVNFIRELSEAKVGRKFEGSEEVLSRLALRDPDDPEAPPAEKGTRIVLKNDNKTVLVGLILGSSRERIPQVRLQTGRYLRFADSKTVYLIDEQLEPALAEPPYWLDRQLAKVHPSEVKRISCYDAAGKGPFFTFERSEPGKELQAVDLEPSSKIREGQLKQLANGLWSLYPGDVVDRAPPEAVAGFPFRLDYESFNGMIYRVYPSTGCAKEAADQCLIRLQVDYQQPSGEKKETDSSADDKGKPEKTPEELSLEAKTLNERFSPWVYSVTWAQHLAFITDLNKLVEKDKASK